ncbi:MAG: DNA helicase [Actinomyces sp.]|uniref:DNA helicase n=1 Tax=Actinomyces sp. TaxID=29317 RepID=UPI0026DC8338|nr:DNA helicase [Actinomyces sp.]MDO4244295.1 DNA helicase [Actinomyces sp.]
MTPSLFSFGRSRRKAGPSPKETGGVAAPSEPTPPVEPIEEPVLDSDGVPVPDKERSARVDAALESWREELADLGGVASLDAFTHIDGVVDLTAAHPSGLAQLYAGRPTHLSSLVRERSALSAARQGLRAVAGRTDLLARQFGVAPVYLAIGVATWTEQTPSNVPGRLGEPAAVTEPVPAQGTLEAAEEALDPHGPEDTGQEPEPRAAAAASIGAAARLLPITVPPAAPGVVRTVNAPVLLRPVRLASASTDATLTLDPSIEVNPVLTRALRAYGSTADVEALARASLTAQGFTPRAALARIASLGREYLPGFEMHEQLVVGAFVHPGQALVEDFDATAERARASALVAALAGDPTARAALDVTLPDPVGQDRSPELERGAGDLDPAQLDAIEAVGSGASFLLDAPPGSEVAATLAAIAADAAASGRTVLHVPATSADGHAVAEALEELGLGGMVLDLTEDAAWRRHAAEGIKEALGAAPVDLDVTAIVDMRELLISVRTRLARYISALHEPRRPWGVSAYDALQELADLTSGRVRARTTARVEPGRLERLDEAGRQRAGELLHRAHALGLLTPEAGASAWKGITVTDIDEATDTIARLVRLADELLPTIEAHADEVTDSTGITRAVTLEDWCVQLEMLDGVRDSLDVFVPEVFERSAADMVIATATKRWREERGLEMGASTRRRFVKQAKDLVRPGREVADLHGELVKVQRHREVWRRYDPDGGWPRLPQGLDAMERTAARARRAVEELQPVLGRADNTPDLATMPLTELHELVRALADDDETAQNLPEVNRVMDELTELGLAALVDDLARRRMGADQIDDELTYCWWSSLLSQVLREDADMGGLDAAALSELSASLRDLDAAQSDSLPGPVSQACARRVRTAVQKNKAEARALYIALSREDGVPLREIIAAHPVALVAKPVWIVPPTLVPQVLAPDAVIDLAVLDASAHMPVAQVLPAFVRAEQVLVVGDPRRASSGLAAELGPLLPRVTLPTGRNNLDPHIAAFLAANGYEGVVEPIPTPPGETRMSLEVLEGRGMPAPGQTAVESVPAEVDRVVDLVIDHALSRPEETLGVVALNTRHADEIRRAIAPAVAGSPALEEFFAAGIAEPFVVVDLADARSLRRDHVIISVGYAKTPHGRTIHSFGAVSEDGGMVALVEALAASRGRTRIVSCLGPQDIDPERLRAPGARLLHEVLVRASGADPWTPESHEESVPDRLLVDLAEHLWRRGLVVVPRYGHEGGPRIPLAIGHPDCPGELLVAVLTDDEQYVAEPSLRRRDRHWVERLQRRGWRVHTAYSAGVFVDPEAEASQIEELVLAVLTARAQAVAVPSVAPLPARVEDVAAPDPVQQPRPAAGRERAPRPPIAQGLPLQAYSDDQLDELVAWIRTDGVDRSAAEEVEELRSTLVLHRRGAGIDAVLANAVRRTR